MDQTDLPPPARVRAYRLTTIGQELNEAMMPLAMWGTRYLTVPIPEDEYLGAVPAISALRVMFAPQPVKADEVEAEIHLGPDCFRVSVAHGKLDLAQGFAPEAELAISTEPEALVRVASGDTSVQGALREGELTINRGTAAMVEQFFRPFQMNLVS